MPIDECVSCLESLYWFLDRLEYADVYAEDMPRRAESFLDEARLYIDRMRDVGCIRGEALDKLSQYIMDAEDDLREGDLRNASINIKYAKLLANDGLLNVISLCKRR